MRYTLSKYASDGDVIHFYCFDVADGDEVVVTKYNDSDVVFEVSQTKADARKLWRLLASEGYTKSQAYAN